MPPRSLHVQTQIGNIAVHIKEVEGTEPLLLLHGVYLSSALWDDQLEGISDRTTITIDMPLHGDSQNDIRKGWTLEDCGEMVIEILDELEVNQVIGIGHSWGSMSLLHAAHRHPERFLALGFCNMPFEAATPKRQKQFKRQHRMLIFRKFYEKQAAKALMGPEAREDRSTIKKFQSWMGQLTNRALKATDKAVIIDAIDESPKLKSLKVPALALKGEEDYVPAPPGLPLTLVKGGHLSPMEVPEAVAIFIRSVENLAKQTGGQQKSALH